MYDFDEIMTTDREVADAIKAEMERQNSQIQALSLPKQRHNRVRGSNKIMLDISDAHRIALMVSFQKPCRLQSILCMDKL